MGQVIGNIIGIVLMLLVVTLAIKALFFVLGLFGLLIGLFGLLLKMAVIGGLLYLGWQVLQKVCLTKKAM